MKLTEVQPRDIDSISENGEQSPMWMSLITGKNVRSGKAGFSLIELMVVMAVIAIIASLTIPSFLRWRTDAKLRGAISNLKGDLELAKMLAIRENAFVVTSFESDGNYVIFIDNGEFPGDWEEDPDEFRVRNRQLPSGIILDSATTLVQNQIRFAGRGVPDSSGDFVLANQRGNQMRVNVNLLGKITLQ
jgi:type IV fimbrial biogenesis protein FimT